LKKLEIASYIETLQDDRSERTQVDSDYVLTKLRRIADATIDDYIDFDGTAISFKDFMTLTPEQLEAIESIKQGRNGIELKLHGKSWTLEMIAKHIGFYEKDNDQRNQEIKLPSWMTAKAKDLSDDALAQILAKGNDDGPFQI
jgi:phage terminase small subunit